MTEASFGSSETIFTARSNWALEYVVDMVEGEKKRLGCGARIATIR